MSADVAALAGAAPPAPAVTAGASPLGRAAELLALVGRPFWGEAGTAGCPHCGSPRIGNENPAQSWEYGGQTCTLLRCADCGGLFTFPWPPAALIERLYKEGFSYRWYGDHYPAKLLDALHRVLQYRALGVLMPGRVLDYGGGLGYFSQAARLLGYQAATRDPMYEKATDGDKSALAHDYAVIACHHVLEHALAPIDTLRDIRGRLAHGGRVILAVPNAGGRGYREQGSHWVWCQPPFIHLHHFTARGLRSLVERAGFVVESEHYFERWDANSVADLRLVQLFRHWDAGWGRAGWKWGTAQRNSLLRFAALLWTGLTSREPPAERSELLLVLRAADAAEPAPGPGAGR